MPKNMMEIIEQHVENERRSLILEFQRLALEFKAKGAKYGEDYFSLWTEAGDQLHNKCLELTKKPQAK